MNPHRVQKSGALRTASGADAEAKYQDQLIFHLQTPCIQSPEKEFLHLMSFPVLLGELKLFYLGVYSWL